MYVCVCVCQASRVCVSFLSSVYIHICAWGQRARLPVFVSDLWSVLLEVVVSWCMNRTHTHTHAHSPPKKLVVGCCRCCLQRAVADLVCEDV